MRAPWKCRRRRKEATVGKPSEKEKDALAEQVANLNQRVNELAERIEKVAQALGRLGVGTD